MRLRFRKNDPGHNLLTAVQHFVKAKGGHLIMVGSIEIQYWGDGANKFRVAVHCVGRPPTVKKDGKLVG